MSNPVSAWKCTYCDALFTSQADTLVHEEGCPFNQKSRTCHTCLHESLSIVHGLTARMCKEDPKHLLRLQRAQFALGKKLESVVAENCLEWEPKKSENSIE